MSEFEVVVLGVGDAFSEKHRSSALLLVCDGYHLAIDCPDSYRAVLRAAERPSGRSLPMSAIDHVLLTHVHGDHMNGLEGFAFYKHFVEGKRTGLTASPEVLGSSWPARLASSMGTLWNGHELREMGFEDYFAPIELDWADWVTIGPFRIRARRTLHHVPTSAVLIHAAGRTLGYSSDTAFDPGLIEFLQTADVIVHETNDGPAHTPYASLAALPEALRARMRLIHYPDGFDTAGSTIAALREGEVLRV